MKIAVACTSNVLLLHLQVIRRKRNVGNCQDKNSKKYSATYRRLLVNLMSDDARALEYVLAGTGGETHFIFAGTCVLIGAVFTGELTLRTTCVRRDVAEIGRGKSCYERALI